ncbi:MAG: RecB-like helicase [Sulfurovaceae bacterium]|nr:RecB-like helicase [Sulfurovaceae bacterium]
MMFKPYLAYLASAGSGKTFALSVRYLSLLFLGESPNSILAVTFTNKATAEMRNRILKDIVNFTNQNDPKMQAVVYEVSKQTGKSKEELFAMQPNVLDRFLTSTNHIATLDSFFGSILRTSSLEIGIEPDFITKDDKDTGRLENYFLDELFHGRLLTKLVKLAVELGDKELDKILPRLKTFYSIDPLLPNKKYSEIDTRDIEKKIDKAKSDLRVVVEQAGASRTAIEYFDPSETSKYFGSTVFNYESLYDHRNYKKALDRSPQIEDSFQNLKFLLREWIEAKESSVLFHFFEIYDHYKNAVISDVKRSGVMDFNDVSYFAYRLLHEHISKEFLYFKLDAKFRHILLDEFQDTSMLQFLLLAPMIDEVMAGCGQHEFKSLFFVGDTKQAIYRFRGGAEEVFGLVSSRYDIKPEPMYINYRSSKNIVEQVNRWFESKMDDFTPQKSKDGVGSGFVEVRESSKDSIIDDAILQVKRLLQAGADLDDIAFLVMTNDDGSDLQEACELEGIETILYTSSSLKTLPQIAPLVAMMEYLFNGEKIDAIAMIERSGMDLPDTSWFSPFGEPIAVIDRLIKEFNWACDANVLKLLEFASDFHDIPTFLEEFADSNIAVASGSIYGAKIITVHKSKGLEFKYIILLDKFKGENRNNSDPFIFEYNDDLYVDKIFYKKSKRENFDPLYVKAKDKETKAKEKDHKNMLYVALTRAEDGMIIIKKDKESRFDILGLEPMILGDLTVKAVKQATIEKPDIIPAKLSYYGVQENTKKEEREIVSSEDVIFGTALHYTLEMLPSFDVNAIQFAMESLYQRYGRVLGEKALKGIKNRIDSLIFNQEFISLLDGALLYREQSLSYNANIKQIDLLLSYDNKCTVVDYKSSPKEKDKHIKQVKEYCAAIKKITGKPTNGLIVYLLEDKIDIISLK